MNGPSRRPAGTPQGGQFAASARGETGVQLTPTDTGGAFVTTRTGVPVALSMRPGLEGRTAGLPDRRPADWEPFGNALDRTVDSVLQGKLSRGVAGGDQSLNLSTWRAWATEQGRKHGLEDPQTAAQYDEFVTGLEHGVLALMSDKAEVRDTYVLHRLLWESSSHPRQGDYEQARRLATFKRTSKTSRQEWVRQSRQAPSEAAHRGFLTAGLVLSGLDDWWGLREDPHRTVVAS